MRVKIKPGRASGKVLVPSSKSYAHRMVIAGSLAKGETRIENITFCEDILATMDCVSALGTACRRDGNAIVLTGSGADISKMAELPCRESGSTLRFMVPVALLGGGEYSFTGAKRLFERGIGVYEDALSSVSFEKLEGGIKVKGGLSAGEYVLPGNVSSQYITGLLFALPMLSGDSVIKILPPVESRKYIDITVDVLSSFGISIEETEENVFFVKGSQKPVAKSCAAEGDWSGAAFLLALNELGGDVELLGLNPDSLQSDRAFTELVREMERGDSVIDISDCPDLGPVLFAVAAFKGGAKFTGTRRLRIKESDRASVMARELSKFGVSVDVYDNDLVVHPGGISAPSEMLFGHNDHRIVMSLAALCTVTGGEIEGADAIAKSYPGFFEDLSSLGVEVIYEAD